MHGREAPDRLRARGEGIEWPSAEVLQGFIESHRMSRNDRTVSVEISS